MTSEKSIGRLSLYRRLVEQLQADGVEGVFSHELAAMAGATAAQVRRDLMVLQIFGNPKRGYATEELVEALGTFLDAAEPVGVCLVGVGNLGRALLDYFHGRRPRLYLAAAFDRNPQKTGRVIHGCRCFPMEELEAVIRDNGLRVAVISVPASAAQATAERLVAAGVTGILNFAPVRLRVDPHVYVEDLDITMSLEKVSWFARKRTAPRSEDER